MTDDQWVGLDKEPFVAGADTMIDTAVRLKGLANAEDGQVSVLDFEPCFSLGWPNACLPN